MAPFSGGLHIFFRVESTSIAFDGSLQERIHNSDLNTFLYRHGVLHLQRRTSLTHASIRACIGRTSLSMDIRNSIGARLLLQSMRVEEMPTSTGLILYSNLFNTLIPMWTTVLDEGRFIE
jgi:hypothetical protein